MLTNNPCVTPTPTPPQCINFEPCPGSPQRWTGTCVHNVTGADPGVYAGFEDGYVDANGNFIRTNEWICVHVSSADEDCNCQEISYSRARK